MGIGENDNAGFKSLGKAIDKHQEFKNEERNRYYGKRRGDIVSERRWTKDGYVEVKGEVYELGFMDNNCIYVKFEGDEEPVKCVAEWCKIITKVEDREDYSE